MKITVRFADGADPVQVEAPSAPAALREVNQLDAYVLIPIKNGYEAVRYNLITQLFEITTGRTPAQALENLFNME